MTTGRPREAKKAGYAALVEMLDLDVITNWHESTVAATGTHRVVRKGDIIQEVYPQGYWPGETVGDHLEFALKHEGVSLEVLAALFRAADEGPFVDRLCRHIQGRPTGQYTRRLWFLYEFLMDRPLPLEDVTQGNYIDLLDPKRYYTAAPVRSRRHRIDTGP